MSDIPERPVEQQRPINPPAGMMELWIRIPKRKQVMTMIILVLTVLVYMLQIISQNIISG